MQSIDLLSDRLLHASLSDNRLNAR